MAKTTVTPPDLEHLTLNQWLELWDEYAKVALNALLSFHGSEGSAHTNGAEHIGEIADAMVAQRIARMAAAKEMALSEKENKKGKKV